MTLQAPFMFNKYNVNTLVRVSVTFTDTADALVDPTLVVLTVTPPELSPVIYTDAVRDSAGKYHRDILCDTVGVWQYQWQGSGAVIAASPVGVFQGV